MSHFTVLVIGSDPEKQLAPFQENNMDDCPKEYLEFHDIEDEYRKEYETDSISMVEMPDGRLLHTWDDEFRKQGEVGVGTDTHEVPKHLTVRKVPHTERYSDFESFLKDWNGTEKDENGRYGYWGNPNAKWDWYQLGGRWNGILKLKPNTFGKQGEVSWQSQPKDAEYVDQALIRDIDFVTMRNEAEEEARIKYEMVESLFCGHIPRIEVTWSEVLDGVEYEDLDITKKREFYHGQSGPMAMKTLSAFREDLNLTKEEKDFIIWGELTDFQIDKKTYVENAGNECFTTFSVLKDGEWYERGKMLWWASVSNNKEDKIWNREFKSLLDSLPDDTMLSVYDCHI